MSAAERYLLCRPRGGLNDTLCRIAVCWQYAAQFDRCLVIDARKSGLGGQFGDFFEVVDRSVRVIPVVDDALLAHLNALECRPSHLAGRLEGYSARFATGLGFVDADGDRPTRFDPTTRQGSTSDFGEPLLVHEDSGGGTASLSLLPRLRLRAPVAEHVRRMVMSLERPYHAVHVRHTDYQTDYPTLFTRIRGHVGTSPLLVCSDDPQAIEDAERYFSGPILQTNPGTRSMHPTRALHAHGAQADPGARRQAAVEALVDLFALAHAEVLYYAPVHHTVDGELLRSTGRVALKKVDATIVSGFSQLAHHLCVNKQVIHSLMGDAAIGSGGSSPGSVVRIETRSRGSRLMSRVRRHLRSLFRSSVSAR